MTLFKWSIYIQNNEDLSWKFKEIDFKSINAELASNYTHNFAEFFHGKMIPDVFGHFIKFTLPRQARGEQWPDFSVFGMQWILASARMRAAIAKFTPEDAYQWIETIIDYDNNKNAHSLNYQLFNCLRHIQCVDEQKSAIRYRADGSPWIDKLVARAEALEGISGIFRVAEFPSFLLVTADLHEYGLSEGIGGMWHEPVRVV